MRRRAVVRQEDQRRVAYKNMVRMPGCTHSPIALKASGLWPSHGNVSAASQIKVCSRGPA